VTSTVNPAVPPTADADAVRLDALRAVEQRLLRCTAAQLRDRLPGDGQDADTIKTLLDGVTDERLHAAIRNLGGHDLAALKDAFAAIDDTRPTVIFAYTVKGSAPRPA